MATRGDRVCLADDASARAARHAAARRTMEQREAMLAQLARDGSLGFLELGTR
ncbi:MAG: hypothetical protein AAF495_14015 [Pseudomonadota bacterium]